MNEEAVVIYETCEGWGYKRSMSGAAVLLKDHPCETCKGTGRMIKIVTTEIVPIDVENEFGKMSW